MKKVIFGILMLFANVSFATTLTGSFPDIDTDLEILFGSNTNGDHVQYYGMEVGDGNMTTTVTKLTAQPENSTHDVTYSFAQVDFSDGTVDLSGATWISGVNSLTTLLLANAQYVLSVTSETASHVRSEFSSQLSSVSAVPLPAAVWLFGSALAGFMTLSNRRKV